MTTNARPSSHLLHQQPQQPHSLDQAAAAALLQRSVAAPNDDCESCGERIPPEERVASPMAQRCAACGQALDFLGRIGRSPFCNLE